MACCLKTARVFLELKALKSANEYPLSWMRRRYSRIVVREILRIFDRREIDG
jgi:hypothetical protein